MVIARNSNLLGKITVLIMVFLCVNTAAALDGSGTEQDPWRIKSLEDFNDFAGDPNYWDDYTRLETDVNLAGIVYERAVIAPDMNDVEFLFQGIPFRGVLDGNGYSIRNLMIDAAVTGNDLLGLFGSISGLGRVMNLGIEDVSIIGGDLSRYSSGLCGLNYGTISNCYVIGSVSKGDYIGGICASNTGIITNCYSTITVSGREHLGGLVGYNYGSVTNCYVTGEVSGSGDNIGGLVGWNRFGGSIRSCYATASVSGDTYVGGLAGRNYEGSSITNCYATGSITGNKDLGGLLGKNHLSSIINCYFLDPNDGGGPDNGFGTALTDIEMREQSSFNCWDFLGESVYGTCEHWTMPLAGGYPVLSTFNGYVPTELNGSGTIEDPYLIADVNDLGTVWYRSYACYEMLNDIDLSGITWSVAPIPSFSGMFDGNDKKISNLSINGGGMLGFFGYTITNCTIENLGIEDVNITGSLDSEYIGGLCGGIRYGKFNNCYATGSVSGYGCLGGLCGDNYYSMISNCYASVSVIGSYYTGGLCGDTYDGTINNCYATGSVSGDYYVGGLCGRRWLTMISNCYATGSASGENCVGGLFGDSGIGTISSCHADGSVSGGDDSTYLGGLCGWSYYDTITQCYTTGSVSGEDRIGGLCGEKRSGVISDCYSTALVTGMDDSTDVGGLCGRNYEGEISSSYFRGSVSGGYESYNLGGICGTNSEGQILDCYSTALVEGVATSYNLGGICGWNVYGTISNCFSTGRITSKGVPMKLGGVCGLNYEAMIFNCYATSPVSAVLGDDLGGVCGLNDGTISNCYATGMVSGWKEIGGLCGLNWNTISQCYATGEVIGVLYFGGLVGDSSGGMTIESFWDIETGGQDNGVGIPLTTEQMQTASTFTDAGWDFIGEAANGTDDIWRLCEDLVYYPRLAWEFPSGDFICPDIVDFIDYSIFAGHWSEVDCGASNDCDGTDLDLLGTVDINDLRTFCYNWLEYPPPIQASSPNPVDGVTNVSITAELSWTAGLGAASHDVYFGMSNPPPIVGNQTTTIFDPGTMEYNTTYYWRIDEVSSGGTTTGTVWSFTTINSPPPPPPPI